MNVWTVSEWLLTYTDISQALFLKSTDRVEVGRDDVSIGMMIE